MVRTAAVLSLLVLAALAVVLFVPFGGSDGAAADDSRERADEPAAGEAVGPAVESDDPALRRLRDELARRRNERFRSDAERLADARAWVAANRAAGWPYADIEARVLALQDAVFEGEQKSARWSMNASLKEIELLRALDADGDGAVTDDELAAFTQLQQSLDRMDEHPYFVARFDADGDGVLSDDERARMNGLNGMGDAMAGVLERARIERWDADLDGILTEPERAAGERWIDERMKLFSDGHLEFMAEATVDPEEQRAVLERMAAEYGEDAANSALERRAGFAGYQVVHRLRDAMRIETVNRDVLGQVRTEPPAGPDNAAFDTDGDGAFDEAEWEALQAATSAYLERMNTWQATQQVLVMRRQFELIAAEADLDADGRLSPDEWDARLDALLAERDARLFRQSYDLDADGSVGQDELMTFIDWHKAGSLRADANFDGVVDARDLETALTNYERQRP